MQGLLEVAGQRGIRAGTLMIAVGGLALYQMTSLVLGPVGSRELHVSLAIPTVDADGLWDGGQSSINQVLGVAVAVTPAPPFAPASRQTLRRSAQPQATTPAAPAPIVATTPAPPVSTDAPVRHVKGHHQPTKHHESD